MRSMRISRSVGVVTLAVGSLPGVLMTRLREEFAKAVEARLQHLAVLVIQAVSSSSRRGPSPQVRTRPTFSVVTGPAPSSDADRSAMTFIP